MACAWCKSDEWSIPVSDALRKIKKGDRKTQQNLARASLFKFAEANVKELWEFLSTTLDGDDEEATQRTSTATEPDTPSEVPGGSSMASEGGGGGASSSAGASDTLWGGDAGDPNWLDKYCSKVIKAAEWLDNAPAPESESAPAQQNTVSRTVAKKMRREAIKKNIKSIKPLLPPSQFF